MSTSKSTMSFLLLLMCRAEQVLPGSKEVGREREVPGDEGGARNGPNNVCTYE
jgi:hypothetical protein